MLQESGIDMIIISKEFEILPFRERMINAYGMWGKPIDLEQIRYTSEEFDKLKKRIGIVQQAVKGRIKI